MLRKFKEVLPLSSSGAAGLAALGFALSITLGNAVLVPAGLPPTGSPLSEVTEFFADRGTAVALGSATAPAAWLCAALFGAGALAALRRHGRGRGEVGAVVGLVGLVLQNGAFAGVVALRLALASAGLPDGTAARGLRALHDALFTLNGAFLATALVGLSAAGLRAGLLARWHGVLGLVAAALMFASATLTPLVIEDRGPLGLLGLAGWLLWVVWTGAYGVVLLRLPRVPSRSAPPVRQRSGAAPGTA
ncbi:2-oxoglutarate/malate transporter [Streptomyces sp. JNUCC 64]